MPSRKLIAAVLSSVAFCQAAAADDLAVTHAANTDVVCAYDIFEITFTHDGKYRSPFFDVTIDAVFIAPDGQEHKVGGFFYGSKEPPKISSTKDAGGRTNVNYHFAKLDTWKARFAPAEPGAWKYRYVFANKDGQKAAGEGAFRCIRGRRPNPGFLRINKENPFRFVFDNGEPFFPVGLQDCWGDGSGTGSVLDTASMEGPFRTDLANRPKLPPGAMYQPGPSMNPQNADVYFRRFARCGFNFYRFSQQNCSYSLYGNLDNYRIQECVMTDELLAHCQKYDMRVMYGLFGYKRVFVKDPLENAEGMAKVRRFIKYSVDRWGAYVDIWELLNEQHAGKEWYDRTVPYLKSLDPYHHPVTTSWERPEFDYIEINAPHWYQNENELHSDTETANRARRWKTHGKPVIVGEQGNTAGRDRGKWPPGVGGVWDARSARRMRIRCWTAFFNEVAFVFWNTSYAKDGHFMNIWLGPREREYVHSLQAFSRRLGADARVVKSATSKRSRVRSYALASGKTVAVYLHQSKTHERGVRDLKVHVEVPAPAKAYWYSPATAAILKTEDAREGTQSFEAPEFTVDMALLITPDGPPDIDGDGKPNDTDDDDDNDGVPDADDAFPLDPSEWADADGDLIGDNLDADIDADGTGDDRNRNGKPDHEEMDLDGDGVPRTKAVPWDAFPRDPKEWRDTDGDSIGDNDDNDDDNDGFSDEDEAAAGTDPESRLSFPRD